MSLKAYVVATVVGEVVIGVLAILLLTAFGG